MPLNYVMACIPDIEGNVSLRPKTRIMIHLDSLESVGQRPRDIALALNIPQPTVRRNLGDLLECDFVYVTESKQKRLYHVAHENFQEYLLSL